MNLLTKDSKVAYVQYQRHLDHQSMFKEAFQSKVFFVTEDDRFDNEIEGMIIERTRVECIFDLPIALDEFSPDIISVSLLLGMWSDDLCDTIMPWALHNS
jgi:hypothetical protein